MEQLPDPLTPPGCDLRDFAYMPLDVARLRDSDLAATESPESCWAAVLLWSASWHQIPAASLPDDDRVLSNLSGYGRVVKEWQRVKDGAMRGWVKCSDGRLYHPVVAEKARESWDSKQRHAYGKMGERLRKLNKQRAENQLNPLAQPSFEQWISAGKADPVPPESHNPSAGITPEKVTTSAGKEKSSAEIPPENALKGEGEGEGEGEGYLNTYSSDLLSESKPEPEKPLTEFCIPLNDSTEYRVPVSDLEEWEKAYLAVDVPQELREIRTWSLANKPKRKTKAGVNRFIVSWLSKAQDTPSHQRQARPPAYSPGNAWDGAK